MTKKSFRLLKLRQATRQYAALSTIIVALAMSLVIVNVQAVQTAQAQEVVGVKKVQQVRITVPAKLFSTPQFLDHQTVLPVGAVVSVLLACEDWVKIRSVAGDHVFVGYVKKSETTWQQ